MTPFRKHSISFKFTLMLLGITLIILFVTSILSYYNQLRLYKKQRKESIQFVASYLEGILVSDDIYFVWYQDYFLKKHDTLLVPHDFDDAAIQDARHDYEETLSKEFPGKVLGTDITFEELSDKTKDAYEIYSHEYYLSAFEKAREMFNLAYVYYWVPTNDETEELTFVLDSERGERILNGKKYIELGIKESYSKKEFNRLWEAWETGRRPSGYDIYKTKKGKTYAYYTPVFINGQKMGVIDVEVEVSTITRSIIIATFQQMLTISVVLFVFMTLLLIDIRRNYIRKLIKLRNVIGEYSLEKDPKVAEQLTEDVSNEDEISSIQVKFVEMIYELENYIQSLTKTKLDLQTSRQKAIELNELALKDSLTGIRNKTSYDKEVQKLNWEISEGIKDIGVAMTDLNFLKKINDTFGHDKGNIAIIELCKIVCKIFSHSPVFRIGGDEFVIILKGEDLQHIDELIKAFYQKLKERQENPELEYWEKTSAAIGYAVYTPDIDCTFENTFKRADAEMYKSKKAMKATRD